MHMHIQAYMCMQASVHARTQECMLRYLDSYTHARMNACIHTFMDAYVCADGYMGRGLAEGRKEEER